MLPLIEELLLPPESSSILCRFGWSAGWVFFVGFVFCFSFVFFSLFLLLMFVFFKPEAGTMHASLQMKTATFHVCSLRILAKNNNTSAKSFWFFFTEVWTNISHTHFKLKRFRWTTLWSANKSSVGYIYSSNNWRLLWEWMCTAQH